MLAKDKIIHLFHSLNSKLKERKINGEIFLVGGAAMCLVFDARQSTKDVDAIFAPTKFIRDFVKEIAEEEGLDEDWLNDSVKGFVVESEDKQDILVLSNLTVSAPSAQYMFAMKAISSRYDSYDLDDLRTLIKVLEISDINQALEIVEKYYPKNRMPPKTVYTLEEIFEKALD